MSEPFNKLQCGPRSVIMMAKRKGCIIDPDQLWVKFSDELSRSSSVPGASDISTLLDIARWFGVARCADITCDINRAGQALATRDVVGVLASWERVRSGDGAREYQEHQHIACLQRIVVDPEGNKYAEVDSPRPGTTSDILHIPASEFSSMMLVFIIFFG